MGTLDKFPFVVAAIQQDGYARLDGYEVESFLPFRVQRPGTLGRDAELEGFSFLGLLGEDVGHAAMLRTPYGNATHSLEDGAKWPEEPFLLHEEIGLYTFRMCVKLSQNEIPVAGMGSKTDDVFIRMNDSDIFLPSHHPV